MARKNPLGKIKDVAVDTLKAPVTVAGSAVDLTRSATGKAAGAVTSLVGGRKDPEPAATEPEEQASAAPEPAEQEEQATISPSEPVNVTEELGLDPAPVEKPKPAKKAPARKPVTKIDAAADPDDVDATPANVAKAVAKQEPEKG